MLIIPFNIYCHLERKQIFAIEEEKESDHPVTNTVSL